MAHSGPTITLEFSKNLEFSKFSINVMKNEDIFFHLKPYFFDDGKLCIVRNSLIDGFWGCEERETPSFPFARGKSFLVSGEWSCSALSLSCCKL
uniref:Galectin n=1 Tax=Astyanax mexicanus TaxID=7994 RepID=A0A3B1IHI9_ASTMX